MYNNFHYAMSLLNTMYDMDIQEDQFEEIALTGWNLIGNKRTRLYRQKYCVTDCDKGVELPCNVDMLEAVTLGWEEWNYSTNDTPNGDWNSAFIESYIEHRKAFRDPLYASGKFVRYHQVGNKLYFDRPYGEITILYHGIIVDEDGLPELTDKEAMALATYTAWVLKYKEGLKTNNPAIVQMAETLHQRWLTQCDQARVDRYISQNEWDEILDSRVSWNRKQYNKSFKYNR